MRHLKKEGIFERRNSTSGGDAAHFVSWHIFEYHAFPTCRWSHSYMSARLWWSAYDSFQLLWAETALLFAYVSGFLIRTSRRDILFHVAVSEAIVPTINSCTKLALLDTRYSLGQNSPVFLILYKKGSYFWSSFLLEKWQMPLDNSLSFVNACLTLHWFNWPTADHVRSFWSSWRAYFCCYIKKGEWRLGYTDWLDSK